MEHEKSAPKPTARTSAKEVTPRGQHSRDREFGSTARPYARLGRRMREMRKALGMNQAEIAKALGKHGSQGAVSRWERGWLPAPVEAIQQLASMTGSDSDELLRLLKIGSEAPGTRTTFNVIDPQLAIRLVGSGSPIAEASRVWIVNQIESAFIERGIGPDEWPEWVAMLRVHATARKQ